MKNANKLFTNLSYNCILILCLCCGIACAESTTELTVLVYENETVLDSVLVDYRWMEENLPVYGDGVTHYYYQLQVLQDDPWDPEETMNFSDKGAVKGTSVRDLIELVGGMQPDDTVIVKASDGYYFQFPYDVIYTDVPRRGPPVICWYNGEYVKKGEGQENGYVPAYDGGMRLLFLADNSTNAEGLHVLGNYDMQQTLPSFAQKFYNNDCLPSTNGLTVKWVDEVRVYKGGLATIPHELIACDKKGK
jgi:hypothetical protein